MALTCSRSEAFLGVPITVKKQCCALSTDSLLVVLLPMCNKNRLFSFTAKKTLVKGLNRFQTERLKHSKINTFPSTAAAIYSVPQPTHGQLSWHVKFVQQACVFE